MLGPGISQFMAKISLYLPSPVLTLFFQLCVKTFLLNIIMYPQVFRVHMCHPKATNMLCSLKQLNQRGIFFLDEQSIQNQQYFLTSIKCSKKVMFYIIQNNFFQYCIYITLMKCRIFFLILLSRFQTLTRAFTGCSSKINKTIFSLLLLGIRYYFEKKKLIS